MKKSVSFAILGILAVALIAIASAQDYSLDVTISGKQTYSPGENLTYRVILLQDNSSIRDSVVVSFSDALNKKSFNETVFSNEDNILQIEKDFPSGYWIVTAYYKDKSVKRFFSVGAQEEISFSINGDKLYITNNGNVPYSHTLQIIIGEKVVELSEDINVGEQKEIQLVAPDGAYNIQITDGKNSFSQNNVPLTGTGDVVGAIDAQLLQNSQAPLGSVRDAGNSQMFLSNNFSLAFVFIGAIGALALLLFVESRTRRKVKESVKKNVRAITEKHSD